MSGAVASTGRSPSWTSLGRGAGHYVNLEAREDYDAAAGASLRTVVDGE
jgi:hypothetical protein